MLIELNRRAVLGTLEVAGRVRAGDLGRPTPCAGWSVLDLLVHMTVQHHGFAAAARGTGRDPAVWAIPARAPGDPVAAYTAAAQDVLDAFADPATAQRRFDLPEISAEITFSATRAIGFHLIDYTVHGWDLARAIDAPYTPDDDLLAAALPLAEAVPDGPTRLEPGAAFAPPLPPPDPATPLNRLLATLGRSPTWQPT